MKHRQEKTPAFVSLLRRYSEVKINRVSDGYEVVLPRGLNPFETTAIINEVQRTHPEVK